MMVNPFLVICFVRFIIAYCQAEILTHFALFRPVLHGFGFFGRSTGFRGGAGCGKKAAAGACWFVKHMLHTMQKAF